MPIISKLIKYTWFVHTMEEKPFKWSSLSVWAKVERKRVKEKRKYTKNDLFVWKNTHSMLCMHRKNYSGKVLSDI